MSQINTEPNEEPPAPVLRPLGGGAPETPITGAPEAAPQPVLRPASPTPATLAAPATPLTPGASPIPGAPGAAMASVPNGVCQACSRRQNNNVINLILVGTDIRASRCQGWRGNVIHSSSMCNDPLG